MVSFTHRKGQEEDKLVRQEKQKQDKLQHPIRLLRESFSWVGQDATDDPSPYLPCLTLYIGASGAFSFSVPSPPACTASVSAASAARRGSPLLRAFALRSPPPQGSSVPSRSAAARARRTPAQPPPLSPFSSPPDRGRPETDAGGGTGDGFPVAQNRGERSNDPARTNGCQKLTAKEVWNSPVPRSQTPGRPLPRQMRRTSVTSTTWGLRHQRLRTPPTRVTSSASPARVGAGAGSEPEPPAQGPGTFVPPHRLAPSGEARAPGPCCDPGMSTAMSPSP